MPKKLFVIMMLIGSVYLFSFFTKRDTTPEQKIKTYFTSQLQELLQKISILRKTVGANGDEKILRDNFLQARLAYKKIELILEYYFEGDVKHFNGLAVNFIEEEDPAAHQDPDGLQMIESFIFPEYNPAKKNDLLGYIDKLENIAGGLSNNPALFKPQEYMPDAIMEELYRILALGISGFDSPVAKYSLPETKVALGSIGFIMQVYKDEWQPLQPAQFQRAEHLLDAAIIYLSSHNDFDRFDRMEFIIKFLNPLCDAIGVLKMKAGNKENLSHYCLIKKKGSLFLESSLDKNRYLFDDKITPAGIVLGKKLFFEPLLSATNKRSCATCHQQAKAFTDGISRALQLDGHSTLPRNAPTLWNASLQMNLFYDSRHVLLQDVVLEVLGNEKEMNGGGEKSVDKLQSSNQYKKIFRQVFGEAGIVITEKNGASAIAMYLRTLISYNSRFDKYMRGQKDKMNATEISGFNLFMGKAKCGTCHYTPLFNGSKPPAYYYQESEVLGVPANIDTLHPVLDNDPGRINILNIDFLNHAFKTPTLRNVALTAPYMHNGVYKTLEEVIDFYDRGGGQGLGLEVPNQTLPADKLQLTKTEKHQLIAFLGTLTDTSGRMAIGR